MNSQTIFNIYRINDETNTFEYVPLTVVALKSGFLMPCIKLGGENNDGRKRLIKIKNPPEDYATKQYYIKTIKIYEEFKVKNKNLKAKGIEFTLYPIPKPQPSLKELSDNSIIIFNLKTKYKYYKTEYRTINNFLPVVANTHPNLDQPVEYAYLLILPRLLEKIKQSNPTLKTYDIEYYLPTNSCEMIKNYLNNRLKELFNTPAINNKLKHNSNKKLSAQVY